VSFGYYQLYQLEAKKKTLGICRRCTGILLAIMSPRNEGFQAVAFNGATSDAKEPLIATGDAEEEDQGRLEERDLSRLKLSSLLLGLLMGFVILFAAVLGEPVLVIYFGVKSNTDYIIFILLSTLFTALASVLLLWRFIRNLVTTTCSEQELRPDRIWQLQCHFFVVAGASICLPCTTMNIFLGTQGLRHAVFTYANMAFSFIFWYKAMTASPATTDSSKPSSTRRSTAEQTTDSMKTV
jgi:hypothetical protein